MIEDNKPIIHGETVPVITLTRKQLEEDWYTLHQQLAYKTQECERITNKNNILKEELNATKLLLEGKNNQYTAKTQECEKLKRISEKQSLKYAELYADFVQIKAEKKQAEQKLEQIEEYCKEQNLKADYTACEVLQIIDEVENE